MSSRRSVSGLAAAIALAAIGVGSSAWAQGRCINSYGTPACNTAAVPAVFDSTGWHTTGLDRINFKVADPQKEAAFYAALMGWRIRTSDEAHVVLDIGTWGTAVLRKAPLDSFADPGVHAVVSGVGFSIEPWNARAVERELRRRGLRPVADNDGTGFESFHVTDPDGFDLQIGNGRGNAAARARSTAGAAGEAPAPFEATGWQTVWLDHLSYQVKNYKASASFYANLLGWMPTYDEGSQNELMIGDVGDVIVRGGNPFDPSFAAAGPAAGGRIDHISFGISPWSTDGVKAELANRGLDAEVDTSDGAEIHVAQYKSYHTRTPNGFNLQISDSTHDTRLDLALAVNPRRPGAPRGSRSSSEPELSPPQLKRVSYHSASTGLDRDYYVYLPEGFAQKDRWPVLMTLSGNGERGDGKDDLDYLLANGPLFEAWSQGRHLPFVVVAPQLPMFNQATQGFITGRTRAKIRYPRPEGPYPPGPNYTGKDHMDGVPADPQMPFGLDGTPEGWSLIENELLAILDRTVGEFKGDPARLYLTGLSTGGFGTWYMAGRHPDRFAAIAPVAAFCHPDLAEPIAKAKLPLWVFTGGRDPYFKSQFFYAGLNKLEELGHPEVRFTIEADMGHNSWNRVYAGQDLYDWFLAHRRTDVK